MIKKIGIDGNEKIMLAPIYFEMCIMRTFYGPFFLHNIQLTKINDKNPFFSTLNRNPIFFSIAFTPTGLRKIHD